MREIPPHVCANNSGTHTCATEEHPECRRIVHNYSKFNNQKPCETNSRYYIITFFLSLAPVGVLCKMNSAVTLQIRSCCSSLEIDGSPSKRGLPR